ncbi:peptidase M4 [Bacillus sp. HMSC76G11]|nr:peptidase M4 [Bacillus sp. HMSC76G11]
MKRKNKGKKAVIPAVLALSVVLGGIALPTANAHAAETTVLFEAEGLSKQAVVKAFLQSKVADSGARSATTSGEQFKIISEQADLATNTYHVRTVEQYNGIPIYGSGQSVALDAENNVYASFGDVTQKLARAIIPTEPVLSKEEAVEIAKEGVVSEIGEVKGYDGIDSELTIYKHEGKYYLTYLVKASTSIPAPGYFHYFVDALTGDVVESFNAVHEADLPSVSPVNSRGLDVTGTMQSFLAVKDLASGTSYLHGAAASGGNVVDVHTYNAKRMGETPFILLSALLGYTGQEVTTKTSFFADPAAVSAHVNSIKVNNYYQTMHKRNSLDGNGMKLVSTVHIGEKWNNAAWNGNKPGDGGLRSLSDPTKTKLSTAYLPSGHYPDHYNDRYLGTLDKGGVHINSSINNKAAYLISEGGEHYGITVTGITRQKTEKIYYRALTKYLTPSSGFKEMRQAAIQSARDLYPDRSGQPSAETKAVIAAYDSVGVPAE